MHLRLGLVLCGIVIFSLPTRVRAQTPANAAPNPGSAVTANSVLQRELPTLAPQFDLALQPGPYAAHADGFRITGTTGRIHVRAATVPTLLAGVNWYLKYVAHLDVSTNGMQLGAPGLKLPAVAEPIEKPALYPFRYALNENTDGYTSPYWSFERWQHEVDILALAGYNAVLIQRGNDLAVYQAFRDAGYSDLDIRNWITQPAHQNWQWMGNMCCFIQPISLELMQQRAASARRILDLLRSLGITPVLPGFWGVVPDDFAKYSPGAHVIVQTNPWNGFHRPGWLDPRTPAFAKLAASFYRHQAELFGNTTLYDMETFQEGGGAGDVPIGEGARGIQQALEAAHPGALWFMMAWQENPKPELIAALDRSRILIADIEQGRIPRDNREQDFRGARWLFGGLWEFGGRTTMGAPLYDYAQRMPRVNASEGNHLSGIAFFTEGLDTNPFAFELYSEMAWRDQPVDLAEWTRDYAIRRYGADDPHAQAAWQTMLRTSYGYRAQGWSGHGDPDAPQDSVFNAQPSLTAVNACQFAPDAPHYNIAELRPALADLLAVAPELRRSETYRYDLVNLARQVLIDDGRLQLPRIRAAYQAHDRDASHSATARWMQSMQLLDDVLATQQDFLLGRWLSWLPQWSTSPQMSEQLSYDARSILTTWGDRVASHDLHEYANKDWSGLVSSYYAPRWQMYFRSLDQSLATGQPAAEIDWFAFGDKWNKSQTNFSAEPHGDSYTAATAIQQFLSSSR